MTTNIKALAEQVKINYEAQPDWAEHKIENVSYQLSCSLLRVLEDADNLASELKGMVDGVNDFAKRYGVKKKVPSKALESHNKLMEELGGE